MVPSVSAILRRFTTEWATLPQPDAILAARGEVGYTTWRDRVLTLGTTIQLFLLQLLYGNTACSHLPHLSGLRFSSHYDAFDGIVPYIVSGGHHGRNIRGVKRLGVKLFADLFPPEPTKRGRGMPATPSRKVVNTILYVLITGCRWCDFPRGPQWASKSAAHRWLQRWQADGTLAAMQARILGIAEEHGMIQWQYGAVAGSFSPGKGGGEGIAYGRKGKGMLIHSLTDAAGMPLSTGTTPANGDERAQVLPLLDALHIRTGKRGRPRKRFKVLAADKGYDAKDLRQRLRRRGIRPQIPKRVWKTKKPRGCPPTGPSRASKPSGRLPGSSANPADWSSAGNVSRHASTRFSPWR